MQLGMIGLGRMGGNMVVRLSRAGVPVSVEYAHTADALEAASAALGPHVDGGLITGVGAHLASGGSRLFIPIGLSLGRRVQFENSSSSLVPYVEPVIIPTFGDGDSDVGVALGLGADLRINRRFELRLGIGIGDIENFSVGFSFTR